MASKHIKETVGRLMVPDTRILEYTIVGIANVWNPMSYGLINATLSVPRPLTKPTVTLFLSIDTLTIE